MQKHPVSDIEGLRIASEMEKRGAAFYNRAARLSKTPETIRLLHVLEEDERGHQREFSRLYEQEIARRGADDEYLYGDEASAYLSAIAADIVFQGGLMALGSEAGFDNPQSILKNAIASEKDSILFYSEMLEQTKVASTRAVFQEIARQEKGHLQRLQDMLGQLT